MEYEYDGLEEYGGRVLWGRIAFFAVTLLLMFFLGRCTAAGGVPQGEVDQLNDQLATLSEQNTKLNDRLAAAEVNANNPLAGAGESESASEDTSEATTDEESQDAALAPGARTYTVENGDTLNSIAEEFYGDQRKYSLIAEANDLGRGGVLVVGQELVIPPDTEQ